MNTSTGLGTWRLGEHTRDAVLDALRCGYRHIDTGAIYGNEVEVGQALADAGLPREQLFITGKLWNTRRSFDKALKAFDRTLRNLGLPYLDAYLIHWPANAATHGEQWPAVNAETWRALERLWQEGLVRSIGVSNFLPHHLEALLAEATVAPAVNQLELHPGMPQQAAVAWCQAHHIALEAWSPLGSGALLRHETVVAIARRHGVSAAQVCLRWCALRGALPIVRAADPTHLRENLHIADIPLTPSELAALDAMENVGASGTDPDQINFGKGG